MTMLIVGCGYLGIRIARLAQKLGMPVFATTRKLDTAESFAAQGIQPIVCDVLDPGSLRALPRTDTVVHAVGFDRHSGASMRQVYVEGLRHVLESLPPTARFLHVSSTSVYGQTDGSEVEETSPTDPVEESGQVVLEAERCLRRLRPDAILLRFAGIYGPGRMMRSGDILTGRELAIDAAKWLNLIHVEDGARAVLAACARGQAGEVYNLSDGHPVCRRDFYTCMAEVLGAPAPRFVPPRDPTLDRSNRRVVNRKARELLELTFAHPTYREGLVASAGT